MNKKNNRKGFTIVELVIVIAVIAILATVLVPTFSGIITKAQNSAVLQEARNIYSNHVANVEYANGDTAVQSGWIKVDTKYVQITNGELSDAVPSTTAPATGNHIIAEDGTVSQQCDQDGCTACGYENP